MVTAVSRRLLRLRPISNPSCSPCAYLLSPPGISSPYAQKKDMNYSAGRTSLGGKDMAFTPRVDGPLFTRIGSSFPSPQAVSYGACSHAGTHD